MTAYRYGLLLPHFGRHASPAALVGMAGRIETLGFDSVWVRDHLIYHPHAFEDLDRTHVEPFTVLSAIGAMTTRLQLGFASLIPHRHPVYTALALASLDWIAGSTGRVVAGFGLGTFDHEFAAIGAAEQDRREVVEEQIRVMRLLWSGDEVSYHGKYYSFDDVDIHPTPSGGSVPIWYCGGSVAAVRRTVEWGLQGWMPGRIAMGNLRRRIDRLERFVEGTEGVAARPEVGVVPITSPGPTFEEGAQKLNIDGMLSEARDRKWLPGPSGSFETARDLSGSVLIGSADDIAAQLAQLHDAGVQQVVFDLRSRFDGWQEHVEFLGERVLPLIRRAL